MRVDLQRKVPHSSTVPSESRSDNRSDMAPIAARARRGFVVGAVVRVPSAMRGSASRPTQPSFRHRMQPFLRTVPSTVQPMVLRRLAYARVGK